ncbi:MAG: ATP-grasp domain-containing protein [Planctomycetota bacterium]|nr:MAG: ATP-grasp domain-containing protein [Planctomycetota bacterium]
MAKKAKRKEFKKLRVVVLVHADLVPPDSLEGYTDKQIQEWKTEYDVVATLREMGHDVRPLGVWDDLGKIRKEVEEWQPHVAFNLLEEFHGVAVYDQHVVSYLELLRQPYTGCNPRGLLLAHDKALSKQILAYHRIHTPKFNVYPMRRRVIPSKRLSYPLVVKSVSEEASYGISQASIVTSDEKLKDRVEFIHENVQSDALVEEYIEGRELYVGIIGNQRLQTFPIWELKFTKGGDVPLIATAKVKWDYEYQAKLGVMTQAAKDLPDGAENAILKQCLRTYKALFLTGYARIDLRLGADGRAYVLEANPNPNLSYGEDFAESAHAAGLEYDALLHRLITLGRNYKAAWRT